MNEEKVTLQEEGLRVVECGSLTVAISLESLSSSPLRLFQFFKKSGVDVLVERNALKKSQTSVVVNSSSAKKREALNLADTLGLRFGTAFQHKRGYFYVVNADVESVAEFLEEKALRPRKHATANEVVK